RLAMSRNVSNVIGPVGADRAGSEATAGSEGRASAACGRWICVVTRAPSSMADMATVNREPIVRVREFMSSSSLLECYAFPPRHIPLRRGPKQEPYRVDGLDPFTHGLPR